MWQCIKFNVATSSTICCLDMLPAIWLTTTIRLILTYAPQKVKSCIDIGTAVSVQHVSKAEIFVKNIETVCNADSILGPFTLKSNVVTTRPLQHVKVERKTVEGEVTSQIFYVGVSKQHAKKLTVTAGWEGKCGRRMQPREVDASLPRSSDIPQG